MHKNHKLSTLGKSVSIAALAAVLIPSTAYAQIDEVITTAQKRSESVQDVPISINAIDGEKLSKLGVDSAEDILGLMPNVNTAAANEINSGFTIRGVGTNNFHGNVSRAVGVYQDEVSRGTPFSGVLGVYDMERVEVLRGPQNTLFGRNTTGGAINYISKKPTLGGEGAEGYLSGSYGNHNAINLEGAVGLSLGENFGIRASGQLVKRDGLFENQVAGRVGEKLGEKDRTSFRIQGLFAPTDATEVLLSYSNAKNRGTNIGNKGIGLRDPNDPRLVCPDLGNLGGTSAYEGVSNCVTAFGENPSLPEWNQIYNTSSAIQNIDIDTAFGKIKHEFDNGITLTSITAIDNTSVLQSDDNSAGPTFYFQPNQDADFEQFSQEIRLQSDGAESFRWILGGYYFKEDLRLATIVRRDANGAGPPPAAPPGAGQVTPYNFLDQEDEDLSVYGQVEFDFSDQTTLTLGGRYTDNQKEAISEFGVIHAPLVPWAPPDALIPSNDQLTQARIDELIAAGQVEAVARFNVECGRNNGTTRPCPNGEDGIIEQGISEIGLRVGLDHTLDNGTLLYTNYSRGFKSGGFDTRALAALNGDATQPVGKETLNAFEGGFKWANDENTLQLNGAIFLNLWNDRQEFATINGIPGFINIPKIELYGAELDAVFAPTDDLVITAGIGLLEGEITDDGGITGIDEGHTSPNTPPISLNGSLSKDFNLASGYVNFFTKARWQDESIDYTGLDSAMIGGQTVTRDSLHTHDSQFVWDAAVNYNFGANEQYSVGLWVDNITAEKYCNDIGINEGIGDQDGAMAPFAGANGDLNTTGNCSPSDGRALYGAKVRVNF